MHSVLFLFKKYFLTKQFLIFKKDLSNKKYLGLESFTISKISSLESLKFIGITIAPNLAVAYKISAKLVNYAEKNKKQLNQLNFNDVKRIKKDLNKNVMKVFEVKNSVNLKTSYGGTSIKNIKMMISKIKRELK